MEYQQTLTSTFDPLKPSLFELISESQLAALIPPSLRYLLAVATHRRPRYLLRILNSFDELYAVLMVLVERHFLLTTGGGFTENFYGLKRAKALSGDLEIPRATLGAEAVVRETLKLTSLDIWRNLAVMVGVPYLKRKLDEAYDINAPRALLGANYTRLPPNPTYKERILWAYRWFLSNIYPSVNAVYYFSMLAFNLAYLFDNSKYNNPLLWLIGIRMRRLGAADYQAIDALNNPPKLVGEGDRPGTTSIFSPRTLVPRLLGSFSILLPTSIFALKFLEWWHASDFARQLGRKAQESLELPPPIISGLSKAGANASSNPGIASSTKPGQEQTAGGTDSLSSKTEKDNEPQNPPIAATSLLPILVVSPSPDESDMCPICESEIQTATACQTGYVFCYTCIHRWLLGDHDKQESFMKENGGREGKWESGLGRCAVTGRRVLGGTEGLRRIMV